MIKGNIYKSTPNLQRIKQPAHGGLCSIEFVPVDWVLFLPEINPKYNTITQKVRLMDGKAWQLCPSPDRERALIETQKESDGGIYVESSVSAFLPFGSVSNDVALSVMRYYRYLVVVNLPNGIRKLLGTIDNPVNFSRDFNSGSSVEADMGSPVSFSWINESAPVVYLGIPSEDEIVGASPVSILGTGDATGLGSGDGDAIGTTSNYP